MITLYTDETRQYFFIIPAGLQLPAGDAIVIRLPAEKVIQIDPDAIRPYQVSKEEASQFLSEQLKTTFEDALQDWGRNLNRFLEAYQAAKADPPPTDSARKAALEFKLDVFFRQLGLDIDVIFKQLLATQQNTAHLTDVDIELAILDNVYIEALILEANQQLIHSVFAEDGTPLAIFLPDKLITAFWLVAMHRAQQISIYPLVQDRLIIGRKSPDSATDVQLLGRKVNRQHCFLEATDTNHVLKVIEGNPIFLNGELMTTGMVSLQSGDVIQIADHFLRYIVWE